jgi:GNAT superfamily N-acetyltransferase
VGDRWRGRVAYVLSTDPDGAFLAECDGRVVGVAQALKRERLWSLSLLAVRPDAQAAGVGRALLERSLLYGADTDAGLIPSSNDPRALRLYALAGFSLLPTFAATGIGALPWSPRDTECGYSPPTTNQPPQPSCGPRSPGAAAPLPAERSLRVETWPHGSNSVTE